MANECQHYNPNTPDYEGEMSNALTTQDRAVAPVEHSLAASFMPAMQMAQAIQRYNMVLQFTQEIMREGKDYGKIPGVDKPSLLKPGAEKLCSFFCLTPRFAVVKETEQWTGEEPFFYYWYKCQLWRGDVLIAEGEGSCNSHESKYRYRWLGEEGIPAGTLKTRLQSREGKATEPEFAITNGETVGKYGKPSEYWQAFRAAITAGIAVAGQKESSTGRTMKTWSIGSTVYRVPNPDVSDQVNTIQKMAQKRALIAATLIACNASEYYTQDVEDMSIIDVTPHAVAESKIEQMQTGIPYAQTAPAPSVQPAAAPVSSPIPEQRVPEDVQAMWSEMKNIATVCAVFARLKGRLVDLIGANGQAEYARILREHGGVAHANELRKMTVTRQTAWRMWDAIQQLEALAAVAAESGPGITDEDLPPELRQSGEGE